MENTYVLTLSCQDRPGIVHAVSGFLFEHGGNIEEAAQYNDHDTGLFFMRVQFACAQLTQAELRERLGGFAEPFGMRWGLHPLAQPLRTVLFVSKEGHCLNDLLFRWKSGLLPLDIRAIVSNHRDFYQLAASYNVPFHHIPVTAATKAQAEARQLEVIEAEGAELVVLARYMQILSDGLCLGRARDRDVVEGHVVAGGQLIELAVVRDDGADVDGQEAALPAEQQVVQAVAFLADHDHRLHRLLRRVQLPVHAEALGEPIQVSLQRGLVTVAAGKAHAHEEQARAVVVVLRRFFDVAAALQQKA